MKKPIPRRGRRFIPVNHDLRNELITKGHVIPQELVPGWLRSMGFEEAADAAQERLKHRYNG
jgi:hypothetical protein